MHICIYLFMYIYIFLILVALRQAAVAAADARRSLALPASFQGDEPRRSSGPTGETGEAVFKTLVGWRLGGDFIL